MSAGLVTRIGLALVRPRAALAVAGDRDHAGRSGSDLMVAIAVLVLATQLRPLVAAAWLGSTVEVTLGLRAAVQTLTGALAVDLGFLVIGAVAIWAASGAKREVGRSFDLACAAVLPLLFVDLIASVVVHAFGLVPPRAAMWTLSGVAYAWTAGLVVLAIVEAGKPSTPSGDTRIANRAGWALVAIALAGVAVHVVWLASNSDLVRPMQHGDPAPPFALPRIVDRGELGAPLALAETKGKVVVLDFWATWCGPCLKAMPKLEAFARRHPEVAVLAINLDDAAEARALFDAQGYTLTLLAGDQGTSDRYGVSAIPHTVVIDREGIVRHVIRGGNVDLERRVAPLLK